MKKSVETDFILTTRAHAHTHKIGPLQTAIWLARAGLPAPLHLICHAVNYVVCCLSSDYLPV
jgi:hypothetical protein